MAAAARLPANAGVPQVFEHVLQSLPLETRNCSGVCACSRYSSPASSCHHHRRPAGVYLRGAELNRLTRRSERSSRRFQPLFPKSFANIRDKRGRRAGLGGKIPCSGGPTRSRNDAAHGSPSWRLRANWLASCTRFGGPGACTRRAVPAPSDRAGSPQCLSDSCPETEIAPIATRAGRPRKTDCDPSTDFNLCAFEREYSIEAARRSQSVMDVLRDAAASRLAKICS